MMRRNGSAVPETWDAASLQGASEPTVTAFFDDEQYSFEMFGFHDNPIRGFYIEVRGTGNPVPALAKLCRSNGWCAAEMSRDGELLDLSDAGQTRLSEEFTASAARLKQLLEGGGE
jgi:hypothetical protein